MADDIEKASGEPAAKPDSAPKIETPAKVKSELPMVESPSISPAEPEPAVEPTLETKLEPKLEPKLEIPPPLETVIPFESDSPIAPTPSPATRARLRLAVRHRRNALLAASVAIAAALGAVLGAVASGGFATPAAAPVDVASVEERKAMQQSIAHLSKEIVTLKSSVEVANKTAHTQIAKMSDKIGDKLNDRINEKIAERLSRERAEITGSITAPQTVPAASTTAPAPAPQVSTPQVTAPLPQPRPPQRVAAVENPQAPIIPGWSVRMARDGFALVEGHGDVYQVVPGVPVPGLGTVQQIKRQDGRWVVVTPRGIVVSMRDRRYYEPY